MVDRCLLFAYNFPVCCLFVYARSYVFGRVFAVLFSLFSLIGVLCFVCGLLVGICGLVMLCL